MGETFPPNEVENWTQSTTSRMYPYVLYCRLCADYGIMAERRESMRVVFYETADGTCPVADFLDALDAKMYAKVRTVDPIARVHGK